MPARILGRHRRPTTNFLNQIERAIFLYFWEQASATTGQMKDRALHRSQTQLRRRHPDPVPCHRHAHFPRQSDQRQRILPSLH